MKWTAKKKAMRDFGQNKDKVTFEYIDGKFTRHQNVDEVLFTPYNKARETVLKYCKIVHTVPKFPTSTVTYLVKCLYHTRDGLYLAENGSVLPYGSAAYFLTYEAAEQFALDNNYFIELKKKTA